MELLIFLGTLFLFMCLGIPLALVLVICAMVLMFHSGMWDTMIIPTSMLDGANNYPLMAIPFFVFAGEIMAAGGLSKRVVALAQLMVGRIRGGLGYAAIVASIIFAGLMGSSVGEAAALGGLLLPMMKQVGYDHGRAGAVIASGAILGPIIPPSTNFIILGATVSGLSITKLFMIGLTPGIMIGLALMVKTADCQPLLLAHKSGKYIAALHVGWRGNRQLFPFTGVRSFCQTYNIKPCDCVAVRGPSLGPARARFTHFGVEWGGYFAKYLDLATSTMDLWGMTRDQLVQAGIPERNIYGIDICTASNAASFFSYREDRNCGRQAALIWRLY